MLIEVIRIRQGKHSTLSEIKVDGLFFCYGLEDSVREYKIRGSTAIPEGDYRIEFNRHGGMNARYSRRYPDMHKGMLEITPIPNFSYVYLHIGNSFADTAGCILVGYRYVDDLLGDYMLAQSAKAYKKLYGCIAPRIVAPGVEIWIRNRFEK